ncbi:hypothetical protein FOZ61_010977, partial [Perkinsus olseni]
MRGTFALALRVGIWVFSGAYGQVLRVNTAYSFLPRYGYALTGGLLVDNQQIWAQIGTGSSALFFTWAEWYDGLTYPGASSLLSTGAYACPHCTVGPITDLKFEDGTEVHIFPHSGNLGFGPMSVDGITFGLVNFQDPPPDVLTPVHSIGLGRVVTPGYHSLMDQLQGEVTSKTFALYLRSLPHSIPTQGELLLGAGDPTLYKAPLTYVPLTSQQKYLVTLGGRGFSAMLYAQGKVTIHLYVFSSVRIDICT